MQQTTSPRNALHRILFPFLLCLGMAALAAAGIYLLLFHPVKQNVRRGEEALAQGAYREAVQAYAAALSGPEVLAEEAQKAREGLKQAVNILLERDPYAFDEALLVKLAGICEALYCISGKQSVLFTDTPINLDDRFLSLFQPIKLETDTLLLPLT